MFYLCLKPQGTLEPFLRFSLSNFDNADMDKKATGQQMMYLLHRNEAFGDLSGISGFYFSQNWG